MLLKAIHGYQYVTALIPATPKIDFDVASRSVGRFELHLVSEAEVPEVCPDCEVGVLFLFGLQFGVKTLVDSSLEEEEITFVATVIRNRSA